MISIFKIILDYVISLYSKLTGNEHKIRLLEDANARLSEKIQLLENRDPLIEATYYEEKYLFSRRTLLDNVEDYNKLVVEHNKLLDNYYLLRKEHIYLISLYNSLVEEFNSLRKDSKYLLSCVHAFVNSFYQAKFQAAQAQFGPQFEVWTENELS